MKKQPDAEAVITSIRAPYRWLIRPERAPLIEKAKYDAFRTELPFLYGILIAIACGLALTHVRYAPSWLAIYLPLPLGAACVVRMVYWLRTTGWRRPATSSGNPVRIRLGLGAVLAFGFACWALALYPYGDALAKSNVAVGVFGAAVGCAFCLVYMRARPVVVTIVALAPFAPLILFSLLNGEYASTAIAIDLVLMAGALAFVFRGYYARLAQLIRSQQRLARRREWAARLAEENFRLANVDALTLLPNRQRFFLDLDALLQARSGDRSAFAVGLLEVDGLKPLDHLFGREFRDHVLKEVGRRLSLLANPDVIIARAGDRTFGLIVRGNVMDSQLRQMGTMIRFHLEQPYNVSEKLARLSVSVGFAVYPEAGAIAQHLYERAEFALQHAKTVRRGDTVVFEQGHEKAIRRESEIEHHLRRADLEKELSVHFQPIFDVSSKGIVAFEALARWKSPVLGVIPPTDFVAVAERTHLIHALTGVLLRKTLDAASAWPAQIRVSFNLSARDLSSPGAIDTIIGIVLASGIAAHRINFEVTETALINDIDRAGEALLALKRTGAHIYLDDFGTGYSNLNYIHRLPLDVVKIDRSFIADIAEQESARIVVQTIVDLCHRLSLDCIAEGVETASQVNVLVRAGCSVMQGYFFGRPIGGSDVVDSFLSNGFLNEFSGHHS
ncbi:putative bifunctional diguanylate cyclase/phosphodiesterase [Paraburkholderia tagetis]|uniref:EAL domain-containing protein n=1 Tax=Paraburkholderia tagetis TaxID=2913261 RepID=A0A9X1RQW9_9BURK|nr:EAL domain-containing protein [Paraburkholderia tagetis]MCG5074132.1 EAL domain-containing protein [Paraburkholderia tagetis]